MKKYILSIFLLALPLLASAYDCQVDGIYYNLNSDEKTAEVTYKGKDQWGNTLYYSDSVAIPDKFTYEGVEYSVTSIGNNAFKSCGGLTCVTIPNSVKFIGESAFNNCNGLTSMTIPNSVTSIGDAAFSYCRGLNTVTISNSVTSIGRDAFSYCRNLSTVNVGNSVSNIGDKAFMNCENLSFVNITDLEAWFKIEFSEYMSNPLYYARHLYLNGEEIRNLVIPNTVTSVGDYALYNCKLTSLTIPNSVTSIGKRAFANCRDLSEVIIGNSVRSIGEWAFNGCSCLTSVDIPNSVISIGNSAFWGCEGITTLTIGNSVESIGNFAFFSCASLTSLIIPESVTTIGYDAFQNCSDLISVTIPNSVTSIGNNAFDGCLRLTSVISKMENPCPCLSYFDYIRSTAILYVPIGTTELYKSTPNWDKFHYIVEGEPTNIKTINSENGETVEDAERYDASGSQINKLHRGLNIIRMSDGTTKKVIVK